MMKMFHMMKVIVTFNAHEKRRKQCRQKVQKVRRGCK
jgi:hypothetical protein